MPEKSKQLKNSALYMLPVIVSNVLPLVTLPIFTRILTVDDYGAYGLALAYGIFINGIANFGLTIGFERSFFESKEKYQRAGLLFSTLAFVFLSSLLFAIFTYCLRAKLSIWVIGSKGFGELILWTYLGIALMSFKTYFLTYFKNMEDAKSHILYTILESLLLTIVSLFLVVYLKIGVLGLVFGQVAASSFVCIILLAKFLNELPFNFNISSLRSSLRLSLPLTPRIFFGVIGTQFDKYLIGLLASVGGVGVYNLGQKVANISFTFMTAIQNVFAPQVYQRMFQLKENGGESIGRYLTPFLYISILGSLCLALFSEELILILTPPPFHGAIDIVSVLCLLYGTYFFGKQPQLIFAKKTGLVSMLTLIGIILNIIINIPIIYKWGAIGAAWGTLLAGLITGIISFVLSQKNYRIHWESKRLIQIFSLFFLFTIAAILMRNFGVSYELRLGIKLIFLALFLVLGYRINVVTRENLLLIKLQFKSSAK